MLKDFGAKDFECWGLNTVSSYVNCLCQRPDEMYEDDESGETLCMCMCLCLYVCL